MRPHSLFRLASTIYNTPHLIVPESFKVVHDYFSRRNDQGFKLMDWHDEEGDGPPEDDEDAGLTADDIGLLTVDGSLTYKPVMTMCGEVGTSYQSLVNKTQEMADAGVRTIVMQVTSGGGQADHAFESAQAIRDICDENDITMIGYADGMACSAAYALICVCDQVVANPSAELGSIGVLVALMDTSKAMEKAGLKPIFITAGDSKVPYDADGSFKQEFLDEIQADVDRLNVDFAMHVSAHTGLSPDSIMGLQANTFDAKTAVSKGLANAVMTTKQFATYVAQVHSQGNTQ